MQYGGRHRVYIQSEATGKWIERERDWPRGVPYENSVISLIKMQSQSITVRSTKSLASNPSLPLRKKLFLCCCPSFFRVSPLDTLLGAREKCTVGVLLSLLRIICTSRGIILYLESGLLCCICSECDPCISQQISGIHASNPSGYSAPIFFIITTYFK